MIASLIQNLFIVVQNSKPNYRHLPSLWQATKIRIEFYDLVSRFISYNSEISYCGYINRIRARTYHGRRHNPPGPIPLLLML